MSEWIRSYDDGVEYFESLDGVGWWDVPAPRRWHRCRAQSRGYMDGLFVERCRCGGVRLNDGPGPGPWWLERNSRRKERK